MSTDHMAPANRDLRSPLVAAAEAQRPTRWWVAALVVVACLLSVGLAGGFASPLELESLAYDSVFTFSFLVGIGVLALWLVFKEKRPFHTVGFLGRFGPGALRFVIGLVTGALSLAAVAGLLVIFGSYGQADTPAGATSGSAALAAVALMIVGFGVQGSAEEIWFRGYLLQTSARQLPLWFAMALQAVLFGVIHAANPGDFSAVALLNIVLVGVMLGFIALGQGSLWLVCGWHAGWNWCQGNVLGIPVSGEGMSNSLLFLAPTSDASVAVSGGRFGVEGSIVLSVLLLIASVIAAMYYRRAVGAKR